MATPSGSSSSRRRPINGWNGVQAMALLLGFARNGFLLLETATKGGSSRSDSRRRQHPINSRNLGGSSDANAAGVCQTRQGVQAMAMLLGFARHGLRLLRTLLLQGIDAMAPY